MECFTDCIGSSFVAERGVRRPWPAIDTRSGSGGEAAGEEREGSSLVTSYEGKPCDWTRSRGDANSDGEKRTGTVRFGRGRDGRGIPHECTLGVRRIAVSDAGHGRVACRAGVAGWSQYRKLQEKGQRVFVRVRKAKQKK